MAYPHHEEYLWKKQDFTQYSKQGQNIIIIKKVNKIVLFMLNNTRWPISITKNISERNNILGNTVYCNKLFNP